MLRVLKEIIIYILIIFLIVLVFGILFYEQLPSNKLVPVKDDYALPEKLESVLQDTLTAEEEKEVIVTYAVEESDLDKYEDIDQYNPGKINPFADLDTGNGNTGDNGNNGNTGNSGNGSNGGNSNSGTSNNSNGSGGGKLTEKPGK